jgi:hypothetical protein
MPALLVTRPSDRISVLETPSQFLRLLNPHEPVISPLLAS